MLTAGRNKGVDLFDTTFNDFLQVRHFLHMSSNHTIENFASMRFWLTSYVHKRSAREKNVYPVWPETIWSHSAQCKWYYMQYEHKKWIEYSNKKFILQFQYQSIGINKVCALCSFAFASERWSIENAVVIETYLITSIFDAKEMLRGRNKNEWWRAFEYTGCLVRSHSWGASSEILLDSDGKMSALRRDFVQALIIEFLLLPEA